MPERRRMPTYKFHCDLCDKSWTELQSLLFDGSDHVSACPKCGKECKNIALGGTGFQFAGKHLNKQLKGFPDYTAKVNEGADKDAKIMEKTHDAKQHEDKKKEKKQLE